MYMLKYVLKFKMPVILHFFCLKMHVDELMKALTEFTDELKWYSFDQPWIFKSFYAGHYANGI